MSQTDGHRDELYRALPDTDAERGGEPADAADSAAERLLKEKTAHIEAGMADAKYQVERNGEAKVELDAKRMFTGLTKEELLKYQDDPFWRRLRWTMFVLFWLLWLCMLAGAVAIIVRSPKCAGPRVWYEQAPLLELSDAESLEAVESRLAAAQEARVRALVVPAALVGDVFQEGLDLAPFTDLVGKAKERGINVIVDMVANYINVSHPWFVASEESRDNYTDYLVWAPAKGVGPDGERQPPNNWVSTLNKPAWTWSDKRQMFYLHQFAAATPDLNYRNPRVVRHLDAALTRWVAAGAAGVRLVHAQLLLTDEQLRDELPGRPIDGSHTEYEYHSHTRTRDQPALTALLQHWRAVVQAARPDGLLTLSGEVPASEVYLTAEGAVVPLPPAGAAPPAAPSALLRHLDRLAGYWPALQLEGNSSATRELAAFSLLTSATPVLRWDQVFTADNNTWKVNERFAEVLSLREREDVLNAPTALAAELNDTLLTATKVTGRSGGVLAVFNPGDAVVLQREQLALHDKYDFKSELSVPAGETRVFEFHPAVDK